jgi:2-keto-4-pentenoate hydratase/2-oxohepta-3-ene-1,7-dioic acid hydratase in catechol pathway
VRLLRYGLAGLERPGLLDAQGRIRDLSAHVHDIGGTMLRPSSLQLLAALDVERLPLVPAGARLGPCVGKVSKLVRSGPALSLLAPSAIQGARDTLSIPAGLPLAGQLRLGVVIGQRAHRLTASEALAHVAGFCLVADIGPPDADGHSPERHHDGFAPLGPWLVTAGEASPPERAVVIDALVAASACMSLLQGDVLTVALRNAPAAAPLRPGDTWQASLPGLGEQLLRCEAAEHPARPVTRQSASV